jgi:hypothetical protein
LIGPNALNCCSKRNFSFVVTKNGSWGFIVITIFSSKFLWKFWLVNIIVQFQCDIRDLIIKLQHRPSKNLQQVLLPTFGDQKTCHRLNILKICDFSWFEKSIYLRSEIQISNGRYSVSCNILYCAQ